MTDTAAALAPTAVPVVHVEFLSDGMTLGPEVWRVGSVGRFTEPKLVTLLTSLASVEEQFNRWGRPMFRLITEEDYVAISAGTIPRVQVGYQPPPRQAVTVARPVQSEGDGNTDPRLAALPVTSDRPLVVPGGAPAPAAPVAAPAPAAPLQAANDGSVAATPPAPAAVGLGYEVPAPQAPMPAGTGMTAEHLAEIERLAAIANAPEEVPPAAAAPTDDPLALILSKLGTIEQAQAALGERITALETAPAPKKRRSSAEVAAEKAAKEAAAAAAEPTPGLLVEEPTLPVVAGAEIPTPAVTTEAVSTEPTYLPGMTQTEVQVPQSEPAPAPPVAQEPAIDLAALAEAEPAPQAPSEPVAAGGPPWTDYADLSTSQTLDRLASMVPDELRAFLAYESSNRARPAIMAAVESGLPPEG